MKQLHIKYVIDELAKAKNRTTPTAIPLRAEIIIHLKAYTFKIHWRICRSRHPDIRLRLMLHKTIQFSTPLEASKTRGF